MHRSGSDSAKLCHVKTFCDGAMSQIKIDVQFTNSVVCNMSKCAMSQIKIDMQFTNSVVCNMSKGMLYKRIKPPLVDE